MNDLERTIVDIVRRVVREEFDARAVAKPDGYLTPAEAGKLVSVSAHTIRRWLREGKLAEYRVGARVVRVLRSDVEKLLAPGPKQRAETPEERAIRRSR